MKSALLYAALGAAAATILPVWAVVVLGLAAPVVTLVGYFRAKTRARATDDRVQEVHILVNSKMSDAVARIEQLEKQLAEAKNAAATPSP